MRYFSGRGKYWTDDAREGWGYAAQLVIPTQKYMENWIESVSRL